LDRRPEWQAELEKLRAELFPLAEIVDEEPPGDLVERTCALVAGQEERERVTSATSRLAAGMRGVENTGQRASLADLVVVAGICSAVALLFFPAIANSRHLARLHHCQDNLRRVSDGLASYCELAGRGVFPCAATIGNRAFAGIYAPVLFEGGYLVHSRVLICPSSSLAAREAFRIPRLAEIDGATGLDLIQIQQTAGGSYAYSLGIVANGRYGGPRNQGRAQFALAGDAPQWTSTGIRATNHGGDGQNLLFENGAVRFVVDHSAGLAWDDPFHNRLGQVEAGIGEDDAVIAPSFTPPFPRLSAPRRGL
jgi:hypothetical protein